LKIYANYSIKGGVGKTSSAVNLAYLSAAQGARTLLWDLDPQGASSYFYRIKPKVKGGGGGLIRGTRALDDAVKGSDFPNLDIIPADISYRHMDLLLDEIKRPTHRLAKLLRPQAQAYDRIFLDCPPSISMLSESVFHAADALLVPIVPTMLSLRTYDQLIAFCKEHDLGKLKFLPYFSMADPRNKLHSAVMQAMPKKRKGVLRSVIPLSVEVEHMGVARAPVFSFAPKCVAAGAYKQLWKEVIRNLE